MSLSERRTEARTPRPCSAGSSRSSTTPAPCRCRRRSSWTTRTRSSSCSRRRATPAREMKQARWMLKERQEFLDKTQREGDDILEAARVRAERMVQRTEIVREAQHTARRTVDDARDEARRLRHRGRGLLRPEAGRLRDRPRADHQDGPRRPGEAVGHAAARRSRPTAIAGVDVGRRHPRRRGRLLRPGPVLSAEGPSR